MSTVSQALERTLIAFATGWGAEFGGINVFNMEFLQHLAFATQGRLTVICVVPAATAQQLEFAREQGVRLVPLPYTPTALQLDSSHAPAVVETLNGLGLLNKRQEAVWLGHDRITGAIADAAKTLAGGRLAMVHHMSYTHYEGYAESASSAYAKSEMQRTLFEVADVLFAIGPLLRDALTDLVLGKNIVTLIPGLHELPVRPAPQTFTGFMSGRLSADAAKIKQGHLGVAAFANAHKRAYADLALPDALKNQPRLILRGADMEGPSHLDGQPDVTDWRKFAETYADRVVNIQALPYTTDRNALLDQLSRASVAMMPSWHEGFGLAGWEAIAAGVPLIISENSGVYQLLREHRNGAWLNWVFAVDIRGKVDDPYFHEEDLGVVTNKLLQIAKDPVAARQKAVSLREGALSDFTWPSCVNTALEGLGWSNAERGVPKSVTVSPQAVVPVEIAADHREQPLLEMPTPRWELGRGLAESQLLRAEEAAVPFDSAREPELGELIAWANSAEYHQALRLVTGAGGTGKTRLAIELCIRLNQSGWHAGLLSSQIGTKQVSGAWTDLLKQEESLLIVIDYAETRQETLIALIEVMVQTEPKPRVRLLLLARGGGEWWERLPMSNAVCEAFLGGHATSGPVALRPLHDDIGQRETAYEAAVAAYAARLGVAELPLLRVDLSGEHFVRPLYVQMAALLALHGERPASAEGLTKALLNHERRYWNRLLWDSPQSSPLFGMNEVHAAELMSLATLLGGFSRASEMEKIWRAWVEAEGNVLQATSRRTLFEHLAGLYPGQRGLQPLRPDLLGEALVAQTLLKGAGPSLLDAVLTSERHSVERRNALIVLARLGNYRADLDEEVVQGFIRNFLSSSPDVLVVATQSESRLSEWIERAFMRLPLPLRYQATGILVPMLEHESIQLSDFACAVMRTDWERSKAKVSRKIANLDARAEYARAAKQYAIALARSGATASALAHAKESVEVYEQVALKTPRFEWEQAAALTCYGNRLSDNGEDIMALTVSKQVLAIYERLAVRNPRVEPELARSLCNHSISMSRLGQNIDSVPYGLKALQLFERLAEKKPEQFKPDEAWALGTYGSLLTGIGQYYEALTYCEESLQIFEQLAQRKPDRFDPEVASTLANRSTHFSDVGDYVQALELAEQSLLITKRISARRPLIHAENLYVRSLSAWWKRWLVTVSPQSVPALPLPNPELCRAHRIPVLQLYGAWILACYQSEELDRARALTHVVSLGSGLTLAQFNEIQLFWFSAAAWLDKYSPIETISYGNANWVTLWEMLLMERRGRIPSWMEDVAARMEFKWP